MSDPATPETQRRTLHLAAVVATVGVLLALVFGIGALRRGPVEPLGPEDQLSQWRLASPAEKAATARMLIEIWKEEGALAPRVVDELSDPARRQLLVDELVAGIERSNDRNTTDYVPPGETLRRTGMTVVVRKGWDK